MDCFIRLEVNKTMALSKVEAWDCVEEEKVLTLEETKAKRRHRSLLKSGLIWKKFIGDKNLEGLG